jgi:hypothetical protein
MTKLWSDRPIEIAQLLNPAFCSTLLFESIAGYRQENGAGMPYGIAFLVLPTVLHKPTRDLLPKSVASKLHAWIQNNQSVRIGFAERVRWTIPFTKEGIHYASMAQLIYISDDGLLDLKLKRLENVKWPKTSEPSVCKNKARFIGRWFSLAGDTATLLAMWGVRP